MSPIPVIEDAYYVIVDMASDGSSEAKHWSNTFMFKDDGATPMSFSAAADAVKVVLDKFYGQTNAPGTARLAGELSAVISLPDTKYKVYNLNVEAPRIPQTRSVSWVGLGATRCPNEVAAVISYRSDAGSSGGGTLDKTRRGRLYIGPWAGSFQNISGLPDAGIPDAARNKLVGAAKYLLQQTDNDLTWVQYSRVNNMVNNVTGGFVNNAFDTQRRRGASATARTVWP